MDGLLESKMSENVKITCYNKTRTMTRREAMEFYYEGMCCSEGSEHERYETIFFQLMTGHTECSDEIPFYGV